MTTMDTTVAEISEEVRTAGVIERQWLKIEDAVRYSGLSRSKLYELIDEGKIRSVCLRAEDKLRGIRLIYRPSLDAYLFKYEGTKSQPVGGRKGRKSKAEKEAEML
jgi:hypothetical protein